jgi:branched-chain amino acid transport system substrate-binding protein
MRAGKVRGCALAAAGTLAGACSLETFAPTRCKENSECRGAFGLGFACNAEGFCASHEVDARCGTTFPEDLWQRPQNYADAILLATLFDNAADVPEYQAARLAVKQVNDSQGLDGRNFAIVQCSYEESSALDDLAAEEAAIHAIEWMVDYVGPSAVVGPATSGNSEAAYLAVAERQDAPVFISPSATSPALTYIDGDVKTDEAPGLFWRTAPPDSLQGQVLAFDVARTLPQGAQRVAIMYQSGPYGTGLADFFEANYVQGEHVVKLYEFDNDTTRDNAVNLAAVEALDAVVFISSDLPDVVSFLNAAAVRSEYADMPIFLADAARDAELLVQAAAAAALFPNVRGTAPSVPEGDIYETFAASYAAAFEGQDAADSSYSAYSYDAGWLAIYGATWSLFQEGTISGLGSARGLRQISDPAYFPELEIKPLNFGTVRAKFAAGTAINVVGASGSLDYDPETGETAGPVDIWEIADGDFVTVERLSEF